MYKNLFEKNFTLFHLSLYFIGYDWFNDEGDQLYFEEYPGMGETYLKDYIAEAKHQIDDHARHYLPPKRWEYKTCKWVNIDDRKIDTESNNS